MVLQPVPPLNKYFPHLPVGRVPVPVVWSRSMRSLIAVLLLSLAPAGWSQEEAPAGPQKPSQTVEEFKTEVEAMGADALTAKATEMKALIAEFNTAIDAKNEAIDIAAEADKEGLQAEVAALEAAQKATADDYLREVVRKMKDLELETTEYDELLLTTTGEVSLENLDAEVVASMLDGWIDKGKTWVSEEGLGLAFQAVLFLFILFVFKVLAKIMGRVTRRGLESSKLRASKLLKDFFVNLVTKAVMIVGFMIAISSVGIDIGPLLAGVTVLGFVVGFALQGTLSNFASGIMILMYRPYDIGDVIDAGGVKGSVDSMSLVSTTLITPDNQVLIVPNNSIWGSVITNVTARDTRRIDMVIGVGYGDDLDKVEKVIHEELKKHPKVLETPAPNVKVSNLGDSTVDFIVRPWSKTSDYWEVLWDLTKSIKQRFDQEGISIPYPQRDIHVISEGNSEDQAAAHAA